VSAHALVPTLHAHLLFVESTFATQPNLSSGSPIPSGYTQSKSVTSGQLNPLAIANVPIKFSLAPSTNLANVILLLSPLAF